MGECFAKCPGCNFAIGDYYPLFKKMKEIYIKKRIEEIGGVKQINKLQILTNYNIELKDIFDEMGVEFLTCCRNHLDACVNKDSTQYK